MNGFPLAPEWASFPTLAGQSYYGQPAAALKSFMRCYAGPPEGAAQLLDAYAKAGVSHMVLRFAGDHDRLLETMMGVRETLGW